MPDLLSISSLSRLGEFSPAISGSTPAYFGLAATVLILALFWKLLVQKYPSSGPEKKHLRFFLLAALASFILALGPGLHIFRHTIHVGPLPIIPLPYLPLYYLLPGFSGFRTPSRWIILTGFSLIMAAALYMGKRLNKRLIFLLLFVSLAEVNFPLKYTLVPAAREFPPEQIWLRDNFRGAPIIQFPVYNWDDQPGGAANLSRGFGQETLREYYSTIHWHPMYNGYSGFSPVSWQESIKSLQKNFPDERSVEFLRGKGIELVLAPHSWQKNVMAQPRLLLIKEFPETDIYQIR